MSTGGILYENKGHITYIILDRPANHNSMDKEMLQQFSAILSKCKQDENCRAIIVTGSGERVFSAGADVSVFAEVMPAVLGVRDWSRYGQSVFKLLDDLGKPSIAAVNGTALGGGFELALACTFRIVSQKARFGFSEIRLGFMPGWGGIVRMTRLVGRAKASELILTGKVIDAQEALQMGVVNAVVPSEKVLPAAEQLAEMVAMNSPVAVKIAMEALYCAGDVSFDEALKIESDLAGLVCHSEDAKEGLRAFIEKRDAQFNGK